MTRVTLALAAVLALSACGPADRPDPARSMYTLPSNPPTVTPGVVPEYLLNPAVTQDTIGATICVAGWTATVRPPSSYTSALKRRQLPAGADPSAYEEDHWIPLELGGAPRDERNLWPEPIADARRKDVAENAAHRKVCQGAISLADAQRAMYTSR